MWRNGGLPENKQIKLQTIYGKIWKDLWLSTNYKGIIL